MNFNDNIINPLLESFDVFSSNNAFCIDGDFFTYRQLSAYIFKIKNILDTLNTEDVYIGLIVNDDIETYASIFALWLDGKAYIPLHPDQPLERNEEIISQVGITTILDSSKETLFTRFDVINTTKLVFQENQQDSFKDIDDSNIAYVLFTSGSTGKPKGVPISRKNLAGFVNAFWALGIQLDETDRCLQMFELTFDLSVMSYLIPILKGACVYTTPRDKIKYLSLYELMEDHKLTFSLMVPSMLNYLRPYFDEMSFPDMRYSLFCGEALPLDVTEEWSKLLPNAAIMNVYGPTEDTIFCTSYLFKRNESNKSYNGVLSVGKEMVGTNIVTIDEHNNTLPPNVKGELCLSGVQLTQGYWKNKKKNEETFFFTKHNGVETRFYKTGDICTIDEEKDISYVGRLDSQMQVQGFRVELSEIEYHVRKFLEKKNLAVLGFKNKLGNTEIGLMLEGAVFSEKELVIYLKTKLPLYMIPTQIKFTENFPLNTSGKVDKNKLKEHFN